MALTVTREFPAVVGVPLTPQFAPNDNPEGRAPLVMLHVYGPVPPLTGMFPLYATFTVPEGGLPIVRVGAAAEMVMLSNPDVVWAGLPESTTLTLT
jgi:hypothetical protein